MLGLPLPQAQSARRRVGLFCLPNATEGSVELIESTTMTGSDFAAHFVAPNVELLSLRFSAEELARHADEIASRGGKLYLEPSEFELAPYGKVRCFAIRSPEGALVEFMQGA